MSRPAGIFRTSWRCRPAARFGLLAGLAALAGLVLGGTPAAAAGAATVWLAPRSQPPLTAPDFMALFQPGAAWTRAASHIQIFKLYPEFVVGVPDADLQAVIEGLQARHLALALEFGLLDRGDPALCGGKGPRCGEVEGFGGEQLAPALARIKRLGGSVRYVAMDEPLWFGHVSSEPGAPQAPIAAIARNVAVQVATVHGYFPEAQVGDIEPVPGDDAPPHWTSQIVRWADAYRVAAGQPLAFFHSDVEWAGTGWSVQLEALHGLFAAAGIPFGIIYDGDLSDDAVQWTAAAEQRFAQYEADPVAVPDHAILQSWHPEPLYSLPESQPGTMTYLVDRYAAAETILDATRTSTGFAGTLTAHGAPVGGAPLAIYAIDDGTLNIRTTPSVAGTVPAGASAAVIALRVNTECGCDAPADIALGAAKYADDSAHTAISIAVVPATQRLSVPAGRSLSVNSPPFAVTPGDAFTFAASMEVPFSSDHSGYLAIAFLDAAGAELERLELPFTPGQRLLWTGRTDRAGRFAAILPGALPAVALVSYAGNDALRLAAAVLSGRR